MKKILGFTNWGKPHFWGIDVFCPYLCIQPLKVSEISHALQAQHYLTPLEKSGSGYEGPDLYFGTWSFFGVFGVFYIMTSGDVVIRTT